jgi:hypothetical protein
MSQAGALGKWKPLKRKGRLDGLRSSFGAGLQHRPDSVTKPMEKVAATRPAKTTKTGALSNTNTDKTGQVNKSGTREQRGLE